MSHVPERCHACRSHDVNKTPEGPWLCNRCGTHWGELTGAAKAAEQLALKVTRVRDGRRRAAGEAKAERKARRDRVVADPRTVEQIMDDAHQALHGRSRNDCPKCKTGQYDPERQGRLF